MTSTQPAHPASQRAALKAARRRAGRLSERESSLYGEPVQVRARPDGRPIRFVWRSRLYTVRAILEHWVINREWWRAPADPGNAADQPRQPQLKFWRVEASPGPGTTPEVCELRPDLATRAWTNRP